MDADAVIDLLRNVWSLGALEESQLARLAAKVEIVSLPAGAWLFRTGDEASTAYVVASGRLEVVTEEPEAGVVRVLRRGSSVGELALLRGGVRSASIRAQRDSTLISLERAQFEELLNTRAFALALTRALGEQLASTLAPAATMPRPRIVAVIGLDPVVDVHGATDALVAGLRRFATAACLRGAPEAPEHEWSGRVARAEAQRDVVVLLASACDPSDTWTGLCLSEADLIIALTGGSPHGGWLGRGAPSLADGELVCADVPVPDRLIDDLRPRTVRAARAADGLSRVMREIATRVCGRALGVVLSGGGARALSHLGVIEELTRGDLVIDRIGGVSFGAVVAASVARGDAPADTYAICRDYLVKQNPANDYTLPLVALTSGRKVARLMDEVYGSTRIEELRLPFFCTSTDLLSRRAVVHRAGSLAHALLASTAVPGVFPPVLDRDRGVLVDGGVVDNLPVRAMAEDQGGPVIAVDVTSASGADVVTMRARGGGAAGALLGRITRREAPLPRLQETIVRCMTLGSADTVALANQHADLVIAPNVSHIGLLDWRRLPEARRAGSLAARSAMEQHADFFAQLERN
jgi:predicted acylesterase/phospholipase RssA/CRP-like cAMP-binding protein